MDRLAEQAEAAVSLLSDHDVFGRVTKVLGLLVEINGFGADLSIGARVNLRPSSRPEIPCEVVGFRDDHALLMPFGSLEGVGLSCPAVMKRERPVICPDERWLGRVINGMGEPIDGLGGLPLGGHPIPLRNAPPAPHTRQRLGAKLDLGVRAVNTFTPVCRGREWGFSPALCRKIRAPVHDGAVHRSRCLGHRAGGRTRARGAGIFGKMT